MNLLIDFDSATSPITLAARTTRPFASAIALDGIRVLLTSIKQTCHRLEKELLFVSETSSYDAAAKSAIIIMEVDRFLNEAYRLFTVTIKHLAAAPEGERGAVIETLKLIRHSSQHAEDRIEEHFTQNGDSLYGDFFWYYRASATTSAVSYALVSGITLAGSSELAGPDSSKVPDDTVGVYGLNYQAVILPSRKPGTQLYRVTISLMKVGALVNELIAHLETECSRQLADFVRINDGRAPQPAGMAPIIYSIERVDKQKGSEQ